MASISDWKKLNELNEEFAMNIKNVFVFDTNAIFIITNSDNVYSFGINKNGCLGLGHSNEVKEPQLIKELSGKQVISFKFGGQQCNALALTTTGHIYSWGANNCGQLANETIIDCFTPKIISIDKIIEICCGMAHCLALTDDGKIYSWGYTFYGALGVGNTVNPARTSPTLLESINYNIVAIDCGAMHSIALNDKGVVFSWGDNGLGQLGIGNYNNSNIPVKLDLAKNIVIRKIRCGASHSLLLSMNGDIYSFGDNSNGQIGDSSNENKSTPVKLNLNFKCVDIAANYNTNITIAKSENGLCYVWGECIDNRYLLPKATDYKHINDVIIHYSKWVWNNDAIIIDDSSKPIDSVIRKRFIASFNHKEYSDITFKINDKFIYVQKLYLICVCSHFKLLFSGNNWSDISGNEVVITQYSYAVYYAFLKYLYTGCVDIEKEDVINLLDLANSYFMTELKLICAQLIKTQINIENVFEMFSLAVRYELSEFKDCCFIFALKNIELIKKTDDFDKTQNVELLKALILNMRN